MNKTVKRLLCFVLAVALFASLSIPAFAATRPYATPQFASTQYVRRGYTYNLKFYLNSGSYSWQRHGSYNYYRARFDTDMYKNSNNKYVGYTNYVYFTGRVYYTIKWTFAKSTYARYNWYKLRYRTGCRKTWSSSTWYTTSKWIYFYMNT